MGSPTLDHADRDALVDFLVFRCFIGADLRVVRESRAAVADDLIEGWFTDDLALMAELDWLRRWRLAPVGRREPGRTEFEIGLATDRLRPAVERALADARAASAARGRGPEGATKDLFDRAAQVCEALLSEIDRTEESG
jgi:hypothetical protein